MLKLVAQGAFARLLPVLLAACGGETTAGPGVTSAPAAVEAESIVYAKAESVSQFGALRQGHNFDLFYEEPGSPPLRLTSGDQHESQPSFSPDKQRVVYSYGPSGLAGGEPLELGPGADEEPGRVLSFGKARELATESMTPDW